MDRKHIKRNFDTKQTNRIRYDKDDFRVSIKKFDKSNETIYKATNPSTFTTNGIKSTICGFRCYLKPKIKDNDKLELGFKFKPVVKGYYRIEMLYANLRAVMKDNVTKKSNLKISSSCKITNAKLSKSSGWTGTDVVHNRHYDYFTVSDKQVGNTVNIKYSMSPNTCFIALIIKHYDILQGDKYNEEGHELTVTNATVTKTDELEPDELNLELMYYHGLDEKQEFGTNTANLSGYLFDYRDEINFYITNTNGVEQQVFGGYISTIGVDDNLTTMSIDCIDRLSDLDHRYNLTEIAMNNVRPDDIDYSGCFDYYKTYENWKYPLTYLCHFAELPLKCNVNQGSVQRTKSKTIRYGKNYYNKLTASNIKAKVNKKSIILRNGSKTNTTQSVRIFDDKIAKENNKIIISNNNYHNISIHYGLGEAKYPYHVITNENAKNDLGNIITTKVKKQAENITKLKGSAMAGGDIKNNEKICKKIVIWVANNTTWAEYSGFKKTPSKVLRDRTGDCCDLSRLTAMMCLARGVPSTEIWYRHPKGHVLLELCGTIADPTQRHPWNNYSETYGIGNRVCHPPNLPF